MAKIGEQLLEPENSWKRIDDTDSNIVYEGTGWKAYDFTEVYNGIYHRSGNKEDKLHFYFKGSKIRLITAVNTNRSNNIFVTIDGNKDVYSEYSATNTVKVLVYEKKDLEDTLHLLEITNNATSGYISLDCIDLDENGFLLSEEQYNYMKNLQPTSKEDIVFYKIKKSNLPTETNAKLAVYFTDNGEIYVNTKEGKVVSAINFKNELITSEDYKNLQDNNEIDTTKLYMVATNETLNDTKKMNLYYNNQLYSVNNGSNEAKKSYEIQQKVALNATPTEPIQIVTNDKDNKLMIENYKFIEGENNITSVLKEFNNGKEDSFIYSKNEIAFNEDNMSIKNNYALLNSVNKDNGLYESETINKSDFIEICQFIP